VGCEIAIDGARVGQLCLQRHNHTRLDKLKPVGLAIGATATLLATGAINASAAGFDIVDSHRRAAAPAAQQACEQMLGPVSLLRPLLAASGLGGLHLGE